jgi:hypothetical protein
MGHRNNPCFRAPAFRFDPYSTECPVVVQQDAIRCPFPAGTIHLKKLANRVSFVPYPTTSFNRVVEPTMPKAAMCRVFIGQLPYQVTDMQLNWLCYTFGNGAAVHFPERIMKRDETTGNKLPTGCVHAYCDPAFYEELAVGMHKRILIDDTGVWYARDAEETKVLNEYCTFLKTHKRKRAASMPYDTVVVQFATSTYVPPPPAYATLFPQPAAVMPAVVESDDEFDAAY